MVGPRFPGVPFLHGYDPRDWPGTTGFVIVDERGRYWTGLGTSDEERAWTWNPRRAIVENCSPWLTAGGLPIKRGRCVEVLLESEVTMLPLRHWPRPDGRLPRAAGDADDGRIGPG